jgi:hypothetical protein
MGWIVGKIHNEPQPLCGIRGPETCSDEADEFFQTLVGKPVFVEHDKTRVVGHVMQVWQSKRFNNQILASLHVDETCAEGRAIFEGLRELKNNGLSIGQRARINPRTGIRIGPSIGEEISIVRQGAVAASRIIAYGTLQFRKWSQSGEQQVLSQSRDMAEEKTVAFKTAELDADVLDDAKKWREYQREQSAELRNKGANAIEVLSSSGLLTPELRKSLESAYTSTGDSIIPLLTFAAGISKDFSELQKQFEVSKKELSDMKEKSAAVPETGFTTLEERLGTEPDNPVLKKLRLAASEKKEVLSNEDRFALMVKALNSGQPFSV